MLFDQAARVFDGWLEPATGRRVLCLDRRGGRDVSAVLQTVYQQCRCFLEGGRKVLLRTGDASWWSRPGGATSQLLDLTSGTLSNPFPDGWTAAEVCASTGIALLVRDDDGQSEAGLWDLAAEHMITSVATEGWQHGGIYAIGDGSRAVVSHYRGRPHNEPVDTHFHLLNSTAAPQLILEAQGYYCNHVQGCPADPELYAYDRWPAPRRAVEQVIHIAAVGNGCHEPARLNAAALRPASMVGARDHYLWTPDGTRIVSYLNPAAIDEPTPTVGELASFGEAFDHFQFPWVLSALDWRTGKDWAAAYPPGRWGCHMAVTPDSRHIVSAGGPGFDFLYSVQIAGLRQGWNERILCAYPKTVSQGTNGDPFAFPFVLPDGSGVLFNAGWPGSEHGLYLVEWRGS